MLPPVGGCDAARAFRATPGKAHPNNAPPEITAARRVKNNRRFMVVFPCAALVGAAFIGAALVGPAFIGGTRCSTRDRA
jgi:hypothetical protein